MAREGNPGRMPLYRCGGCGFVTSASRKNAVRAHEAGWPGCAGEVELALAFTNEDRASHRAQGVAVNGAAIEPDVPAAGDIPVGGLN